MDVVYGRCIANSPKMRNPSLFEPDTPNNAKVDWIPEMSKPVHERESKSYHNRNQSQKDRGIRCLRRPLFPTLVVITHEMESCGATRSAKNSSCICTICRRFMRKHRVTR